MARPLRIEFPGAVYHVTSRGNEKRRIFKNDADRKAFLAFLAEAATRFGWSITAWVLMTNHFHLVIQTPEPNLSRGMHWLNGSYAGWFNHAHKRWGHLFGGRFKAFLVEKEAYFTEVLRYVVLNPVRAGLATSPETYRWSSYRATAGLDAAPEWLDVNAALTPFAPDVQLGQEYYREFVAAKVGSEDCLWDNVINGIYLGTESWAKTMRKVVETKPRSTDHPRLQRMVGRPKMHEVVSAVARVAKVPASTLRETRGGCLRRLVAWIGWHEGLVTLRTIAASLRLRSEGHVSGLIRRCDGEFAADPSLLSFLDQALAIVRP
ncbi:MAG TPA: transposase [Thermoanaerobaculia bacterium]|jgi:REP element-mobilizing transposase RayT|nr:transposase [Thermoanaerobaculia bacterium]